MRIRQMTVGDADRCLRFDCSYQTDYVWHITEHVLDSRVEVLIERTRLPRSVEVTYPCMLADLADECRTSECFLVADHLSQVQGCIDLRQRRWTGTAWIEYCVVDKKFRGQGIGSQLLEAAEDWARSARLRQIVMPLQTKNDQAIAAAQARGYQFSGYLDRYFNNEDIGLLFCKSV
ncbi:MAG: GNAT family N-acetyltransferase [Anaerolineae bacterium]